MKLKIMTCSIAAAFGLAGCASNPFSVVASALTGARSLALEAQQVEVREGAHNDTDAAIRNVPLSAEGMYRLGRYYQSTDNPARAIVAYKEAIARDPQLADAYNGLGVVLAAQGRFDEAILQFEKATSITPQAAYLRNNLGYAYLLRGSNAEALKVLNEARRIDPTHDRTLRNLQLTHRRLDPLGAERTASQVPAQIAASVFPKQEAPSAGNAAVTTDLKLITISPGVYELQAPPSVAAIAVALASAPAVKTPGTVPMTVAERPFRLEVSNANGIRGIAKRVSENLRQRDLLTASLTDQRPGRPSTRIEYRAGYRDEAARVAGGLQHPVPLVQGQKLPHGIHVRLVLGRDVRDVAALFQSAQPGTERTPVATRNAVMGNTQPQSSGALHQATAGARDATIDSLIQDAGKRPQVGVASPIANLLANAVPMSPEAAKRVAGVQH